MINIPLPFWAMWLILLAGVATHVLYKLKKITDKTPDDILWNQVWLKFRNKEWPSYGMSFIATGIISFTFQFIKQFDTSSTAEISRYAKFVPLAVPILYAIGIIINIFLYRLLGRIESKGKIDMTILKEGDEKESNQ